MGNTGVIDMCRESLDGYLEAAIKAVFCVYLLA